VIRTQRTAVVIGASFAGLLAAAAAVRAGYQVTVLERDHLPAGPEPRSGVPQSEQAHILLHRGLLAIESLLPGIEADLLAHGGSTFNTGEILWFGEHGWMPQRPWSYEIISLNRPLLELVVRDLVAALPGVTITQGVRVSGLRRTNLRRDDQAWEVLDHTDVVATGTLVIDASGRTSRLPHWLGDLGITAPEPTVIDAVLGYATRRYRGTLPITTGAVVPATPDHPAGALVLSIEDDGWLVCAGGYGERRPGRSNEEFEDYLLQLRDPMVAEIAAHLEPDGDVAIHRQTANRRYDYGSSPDWPAGLLVVGDAMCAFNPIYGQGITVAAMQAELLRTALVTSPSRQIQRKLSAIVDLPWSVATSEDLRMPTSEGEQNFGQRAAGLWLARMVKLAAAGNEPCTRAFASVYHLMGSPLLLVSPPVVRAIAGSLFTGIPASAPRPHLDFAASRPSRPSAASLAGDSGPQSR